MDLRDEPDYSVAHLLAVIDDDHELARVVAAGFLALGESLPERLDAALAARDAAAAARVAHELKGMAAMLGARRLAALAGEFEAQAHRAPSLTALREEWQSLGRCLQDYVGSKGKP